MTWLLLLLASLLDTSTGSRSRKDTDPPPDSEDDEEEEDGEEEDGDGDGDGELKDKDGEPIRDPKAKLKAQEEQIERFFKKLDKKDARIKELEGQLEGTDDIRSVRLEAAFLRAMWEHKNGLDREAAWDLATMKGYLDGVKVEDGTVDIESMTDALDRLIERYPYLLEEPSTDGDGESEKPKTRHPQPSSKGRKAETNRAALEKRFPALRGRRRR